MKKKLMSLVLAMTMVLSALPAAAAVDAEPLSEYAGQTIPVQVVDVTENGCDSRIIEVAIPDGATKTSVRAIMNAAAFGSTARSVNEMLYFLSVEENIVLNTTAKRVGGGRRPSGVTYFNRAIIYAYVESATSTNVDLQFQVRDVDNPNMSTVWKTATLQPNMNIVINCGGLPSTEKGISVYAKTTVDWPVTLSECAVYGAVD